MLEAELEAFAAVLSDHRSGTSGIRTRKLPQLVAEKLAEMGVSQEYIDTVFPKISGFGNKDGAENKDGSYTAQIVFYAPEDIQAVAEAIYEKLKDCPSLKEVKALKAKDLQEAVKGAESRPVTLDMALFGRIGDFQCVPGCGSRHAGGPCYLYQ